MKRRKRIFLALLFVALIGIGWCTQPDINTIFNGILTSIIASLLFLIFTTLVDNSSDEIKDEIEKTNVKVSVVEKNIGTGLNSLLKLKNELQDISERLLKVNEYIDSSPSNLRKKLGIIRIENRKEYSYTFWSSFLKDAVKNKSKKFIISGKTLHRWLESEIVNDFKSSLLEMITEKVEIEFVIYKEPKIRQKKMICISFLIEMFFRIWFLSVGEI